MGKADGLSRKPDLKVEVDRDNENQVVIKENWLCRLEKVAVEGLEVDIIEKIKRAKSRDKDVIRVVEEMKKAKVRKLWGNEW